MTAKKAVNVLILLIIMLPILTSCASSYREPYYASSSGGEKAVSKRSFGNNSIKDFLSSDDKFKFVTSRTESGESTKAFLFSTDMSVPEAGKYIKEKKKPFETSDMDSTEKIVLTYDDEYAMIYQVKNKEEEQETIVQASTRQYAYRSRTRGLFNPYMPAVFLPYPVYYERNLLNRDRERYGGFTSSKRSVRTGSTGTNFNRGGGTGFGK